ncbi:MAG: ABC transporter permease [Oscillospiraceae bacterium]|nr:ABC transporter permease [Oscillospiraceae bacterium]
MSKKANKLTKLDIVCIVIDVIAAIAVGIILAAINSIKGSTGADSAASAWGNGESRYAQAAVYFTYLSGFDINGAHSMHSAVEQYLASQVDLKKAEHRVWVDCGYGESSGSAQGTLGSTDAVLCGTWGDYFLFHPGDFISGSIYEDNDMNLDVCVLDNTASWILFGGLDTAGMTVNINDRAYLVVGVIDQGMKTNSDFAAYGSKPRIYMPYQSLKNLKEAASMTSYEICIPYVLDGYALEAIKKGVSADESTYMAVDESGRFDLVKLVRSFPGIFNNVMVAGGIVYPWYENVLRAAEIKCVILAFMGAVILIIGIIVFVYLFFRFTKAFAAFVKWIKSKFDASYQRRISKKYYKTHPRPEENPQT